jgi:hypothetical protein
MIAARKRLARSPHYSAERLSLALRESEAQARLDASEGNRELASAFLNCYFLCFRQSPGRTPSLGPS